ncbi:MAG: ISAzo13-like element transposase-related protein [Ferrimicrobium sp.]
MSKLGSWGGVSAVVRVAGVARSTVTTAVAELESSEMLEQGRSRRAGGGRKSATVADPGLAAALDALVDPATRGDPMSPLRWTTKSTLSLAEALSASGHPVSDQTVASLLRDAGYSLQANAKVREGRWHLDRDAQFCHIHDRVGGSCTAKIPWSVSTSRKRSLSEPSRVTKTVGANGNPKVCSGEPNMIHPKCEKTDQNRYGRKSHEGPSCTRSGQVIAKLAEGHQMLTAVLDTKPG